MEKKNKNNDQDCERCLNAFCNPPPIPVFKNKNKRFSIVWKDRFNVEYEIVEEEYPDAQYDTTFQDYLNQGYQLEQLKDENDIPVYGFQDKKKPKSQQIRDLKRDIDSINDFVRDSFDSYREQEQQEQQQQEQPKGDPKND